MNKLKDIVNLLKILGFSRNFGATVIYPELSYYLILSEGGNKQKMYQTYWDTNIEDIVLIINQSISLRAEGTEMILKVLKSEFPDKKPEIREWQINKIIEE